jgi:hypothetical protein
MSSVAPRPPSTADGAEDQPKPWQQAISGKDSRMRLASLDMNQTARICDNNPY